MHWKAPPLPGAPTLPVLPTLPILLKTFQKMFGIYPSFCHQKIAGIYNLSYRRRPNFASKQHKDDRHNNSH